MAPKSTYLNQSYSNGLKYNIIQKYCPLPFSKAYSSNQRPRFLGFSLQPHQTELIFSSTQQISHKPSNCWSIRSSCDYTLCCLLWKIFIFPKKIKEFNFFDNFFQISDFFRVLTFPLKLLIYLRPKITLAAAGGL